MLDINDLENRYKKYKIKSYTPHATIFVSLIVIITISFFILNGTKLTPQEAKKVILKKETPALEIKKTETIKTVVEPKKTPQEDKNITIEKEVEVKEHYKVVISPSLDFMKRMQSNTVSYYDNQSNVQQIETQESKKIDTEKQDIKEPQKSITIVKNSIEEEIPKNITIKRESYDNDLEDVIRRFKKNNNPALSLFIAKKYYKLGEYNKSYNYALITNSINNEIEASWLIFAKSLVKLNKKDKAIKTLTKYINHSHSNTARILRDDIGTGVFK